MTELNPTYIASAIIIAVILGAAKFLQKQLDNAVKRIINKLDLQEMKGDSTDFALYTMHNKEQYKEFSEDFKECKVTRMNQLLQEYEIKHAGLK